MQSQHRFEPASGHHARVPSEATAWPGLYIGLTREESLAEAVSSQRRSKRDRKYVPRFSGSGWTDGSSSFARSPIRTNEPSTSGSSTASQPSLFSKLICQSSPSRGAKRKHSVLPKRLSWKKKKQSTNDVPKEIPLAESTSHREALAIITPQPTQYMPEPSRLRRTQSAPRIAVEESPPYPDTPTARRNSSHTSPCSPLPYPFDIPEIRRISATTAGAASQTKRSTGSTSVRRGSVIEDWDPFEDTRARRVRRSISASAGRKSVAEEHMDEECIAHTDHDPYSYVPLPTSDISSTETPHLLTLPSPTPDVVAPRAVLPTHEKSPSAAACVYNSEEAGPSINDSEVLRKILAKIDDSDSSDESDSDNERDRKRESISIVPGSLESYVMARRFTGSSEGSGSRLQGVEE